MAAPCQGPQRPAVALAAVLPVEGADPGLQPVLQTSVVLQLSAYRLTPIAAQPALGEPLTLEQLRSQARTQGADYIVLGRYGATADTLNLAIAVYEPAGETPRASASSSGRISLTLDSIAARTVDQLMPGLATSFPSTAPPVTGVTPAAAAVVVAPPPRPAVGVEPAGPEGEARQERWRRLEVSAGGAPLVTTGSVAGYVKIGALSTVSVGLRFPVGRSALSAGLLTGAAWLRATGASVADVVAVPIGADVRWTISPAASPAVSLHLGGGPAVLVAVTAWAGSYAKLVPCALGGLEADVTLTQWLGLRIDASYAVFFEGSMVIQGFAPQLSLRARL